MTFLKSLAAAFAVAVAQPVFAHDVPPTITDAYAISASPTAKSGAAFMVITNHRHVEDRLVAVRSAVADRVELHTHMMDAQGVARMVEVKDGFTIPAEGSHALERGGDHVMFMGITTPFEPGTTIPLTLVFELGGEVSIEVPVGEPQMQPPANAGNGQGMQGHMHGQGG